MIKLTKNDKLLTAAVLITAFFIIWTSVTYKSETFQSLTTGKARDADIEKIKGMILEKKLSDKDALFYKKLEADGKKGEGGSGK
jgi:divalent metal cation (Fe/Co/Zn/Cd) transporter